MSIEHDFIFTIGSVPVTAQILKALDLQMFDFPFDFLAGADFYTRVNLLLNRFNDFLKQENIVLNVDYEGATESVYKDKVTNIEFPFDFNPELPLENTFPAAQSRYEKLIRRFYLKLKKSQDILIVYVENPQKPEDEEENLRLIVETINKLNSLYPDKIFSLLYVKNGNSEDIKVVKVCETAEMISFNFYKSISELSVPVLLPDMLSIAFAEIKLKMTWRQKKLIWTKRIMAKLLEFRMNNNI